MKNRVKGAFTYGLTFLPLLLIILLLLWWGNSENAFAPADVVKLARKGGVWPIVLILLLYAVKPLFLVIPLSALYIGVGIVYPGWASILINVGGVALTLTTPYVAGYFGGNKLMEKMLRKYPKLKKYTEREDLGLSAIMMLRVVPGVPVDVFSLLFGSRRYPYFIFLIASLLGILPRLVPISIMGGAISNPLSVQFLLPFAITIAVSGTALFFYHRYEKKGGRHGESAADMANR